MVKNHRNLGVMVGLAITLLGLVAMARGTATAGAAEQETAARGSKGHGKMVFVLTTGLEDLQAVNMAIRHSGMALKSGYLDDSVLLVYGRGVQAFSKNITAKPAQTSAFIKEAKQAGVRILICGEAIRRFNIPKEELDPGVDAVVPNSIVTLAELVSKGYQVIKY